MPKAFTQLVWDLGARPNVYVLAELEGEFARLFVTSPWQWGASMETGLRFRRGRSGRRRHAHVEARHNAAILPEREVVVAGPWEEPLPDARLGGAAPGLAEGLTREQRGPSTLP